MGIAPIHAKRATFFFRDQRTSWTETYWRDTTASLEDTLKFSVKNLAKLRVALLAKECELYLIRVSDDAVFRDSFIDTSYAGWAGGDEAGHIYNRGLLGTQGQAPPTNVLRVRQEAGALYRRITYLSGIPKEVLLDQGNLVDGGGVLTIFANSFAAFAKHLATSANGWGFVSILRPPAHHNPLITLNQPAVGANITITVGGDTSWAGFGDTIAIRGAKANPCSCKINGKYTLTGVSPGGTLQLAPNGCCCTTLSYKSGGEIQSVERTWNQITAVIPDGFASHKRGGSAGLPHGRSRTRRATVC